MVQRFKRCCSVATVPVPTAAALSPAPATNFLTSAEKPSSLLPVSMFNNFSSLQQELFFFYITDFIISLDQHDSLRPTTFGCIRNICAEGSGKIYAR